MTRETCPSEAELIAFADAALSPEQLQRIEKHLEVCAACAEQVLALSELTGDVAASLPQPQLDVAEHVATVMKRLDARVPRPRSSFPLAWAGGGVLAAAAAVTLFLATRPPSSVSGESELVARGGNERGSLSRDVGVQLYVQGESLVALSAGSRVPARALLTAGLRNLAREPAYLLLFAIDSQQSVHWVAPEFTSAGTDPQATSVMPSPTERLLPSAVAFDDLSPGPLRVVALIGRAPLRVSDIESLPAAELSAERLMQRFPRAELRQFLLQVNDPTKP